MNQEREIKFAIHNAKVVLVDVAGTEFWIKVSKSEALALCEFQNWDMVADTATREGECYLSIA
jgi:translation initiation factor IF-3